MSVSYDTRRAFAPSPCSSRSSRSQMAAKKIVNQDPGGTDGLRIVVLPAIKEWLGVTVVCSRIDEQLVRSLCFSHAVEKIDGCLGCPSVFTAADHQHGTLQLFQALAFDFVKAGPVNHHGGADLVRVIEICNERFLSSHAESKGCQFPAWLLQIIQSRLQYFVGCFPVEGLHELHSLLMTGGRLSTIEIDCNRAISKSAEVLYGLLRGVGYAEIIVDDQNGPISICRSSNEGT